MKTALLHLACVLALIQIAAELDLGAASSQASTETKASANAPANAGEYEWRRTRNGWEPMTWAAPRRPEYDGGAWRPLRSVHPLTFACLQGLISLGALVLFAPEGLGKPQRDT